MPFAGACCIIHPRNSIFSDSYGGLFGKVSFVLHLCLANVLLFRYFSQNALVVLAVIVKKNTDSDKARISGRGSFSARLKTPSYFCS